MGELIGEAIGLLVETVFGGGSGRGRRRRARRRMDEGVLRCHVRMVSGRVPGLTRELADVELELSPGALVCRRRDDRGRAISIDEVTLHPATSPPSREGVPYGFSPEVKVSLVVTPKITMEVWAEEDLLVDAVGLVHPPSAVPGCATAPHSPAPVDSPGSASGVMMGR
ncbi:hypothetical protein Sked_24010 [Sanguibacter keddieii DSM 10542]|uniref:Uncharacterized protein n=1 Tax=Sanguibacter keddieii (strain ATCC 51767 / DSM 10542 / NCFB 3025 / ST-74) TaxID=446469 RepID=D1BJC1_SANKS|nr:hypothetical protein [Sanguibacter keddieii]ACZ22315.1 hypothetical protein Sked_24010 [Sanguibacter keddieii DSM 10542]